MKRYDLYYCDGDSGQCHAEMREEKDGEWVLFSEIQQPPWLLELLAALGWQSGTIHDAIRAVRDMACGGRDEPS